MPPCVWAGALPDSLSPMAGGDGRSLQLFEGPPVVNIAHFGKVNDLGAMPGGTGIEASRARLSHRVPRRTRSRSRTPSIRP
jgi:hypothetical protein